MKKTVSSPNGQRVLDELEKLTPEETEEIARLMMPRLHYVHYEEDPKLEHIALHMAIMLLYDLQGKLNDG